LKHEHCCIAALIDINAVNSCAVDGRMLTAGLSSRRLYPELPAAAEPPKDDVVRPFTEQQLRSLYYNYELEHVDEFVEAFLRVTLSAFTCIVLACHVTTENCVKCF